MKLHDFIFRFRGGGILSHEGICRVRLFLGNAGDLYAVLTELAENPSTSVTNAVESIYAQLCAEQKIPPQAKLIEHYPQSSFFPQTFDLVELDDDGLPHWRSLSRQTAEAWLDASPDEFSQGNCEDARVQREIRQALEGIPGIDRFQLTEAPEITQRRLEIAAGQHSRRELLELLDRNPTEQALAAFLKEDPSFFAEQYANPAEEYLCFSELPIGDTGRVDFALFTGRSRMDVYLIELKDGKRPIRRKNHYGAFRAFLEEGREQLFSRVAWIEHHYERFCRFAHLLRQEVEDGKRPYRAFPGPKLRLQADPEKDIKLHLVLIGGRTSHDLEDSRLRHREDHSSRFDLQTETWDSWAGKLERP